MASMIDKFSPMRGEFKLEVIDAKTMKVIDVEEDKNMIMTGARTTMSKLFAGIAGASLPNKLVIGTEGNVEGSILTPKDSTEGFIKTRNTLFSLLTKSTKSGEIEDLIRNNIIYYEGVNDSFTGLYRYVGNTIINLSMNDVVIESADFEPMDDLPETFSTSFTLPGTQTLSVDGSEIIADDAEGTNGAVVTVLLTGTSVSFRFEIGTDYANGVDNATIYTEAGIFAGDDLFCMKTFPAKIKDRTVIFRINWTIVF